MALPHRALGTGGLSVSTIGLGCMSLSGVYGAADDAESEELIRHAIDPASITSTLGHVRLGPQRAVLAGPSRAGATGSCWRPNSADAASGPANGVNGRPEYVQQACEASLKRLGEDVIDVYYQHRVDPSVPIEETVGAMAPRAAGQGAFPGLVRGGARTHPPRAQAVHPIAAVQTEYSFLYRTEAEETRKMTR